MTLIKGGPANSGTKRPKREARDRWECSQGHSNKGYWIRCMVTGCNEQRK